MYLNMILWVLMLALNFGMITLAHKWFGKAGLYIWVVIAAILANVQVLKTVELFWMVTALGNIIYSTSYLATDILSEYYGKKSAQKAIYVGFFTLIVTAILMTVSIWFVPHSSDFAQGSLETIFGLMPRIALASLAAYFVSQNTDIRIFAFLRKRFKGPKGLFIANNGSTMVSQLVDTIIFTLIAFLGVFPPLLMLEIGLLGYLLKWIVAAMDTPFVYFAKRHVDKNLVDLR